MKPLKNTVMFLSTEAFPRALGLVFKNCAESRREQVLSELDSGMTNDGQSERNALCNAIYDKCKLHLNLT